jgi:hypothetical protein
MDISNAITTEDEVGLATPPMDIGALYLVSHATEIQNVSEVLTYIHIILLFAFL